MTTLDEKLNELEKTLPQTEIVKVRGLVKEARSQYLVYRLFDVVTLRCLDEYGITFFMIRQYVISEMDKLIELYSQE